MRLISSHLSFQLHYVCKNYITNVNTDGLNARPFMPRSLGKPPRMPADQHIYDIPIYHVPIWIYFKFLQFIHY